MPRSTALLLFIILLAVAPARAQTVSQSQPGGPPLASLITVSNPDSAGVVEIAGVNGAVLPNARVIVRNLYTEQTVYAQAGVTGSFRARIFGPGNTPFWISTVSGELPNALRDRPGSLPGGPGTIIFGPFPETRQATLPVTQIVLDGDLDDWSPYPRARHNTTYTLRNLESLYLAADNVPAGATQLQAIITIDSNTFEVTLDLAGLQQGVARRLAPQQNTIGAIPALAVARDQTVEARVPLTPLDDRYDTVTLNEVRWLNAESLVLTARDLNVELMLSNEVDGVVRLNSRIGEAPTRFTVGGAVGGGASYWSARGRVDRLRVPDRELPLQLELDITLNAPDFSAVGLDLRMIGQIGLLPVVADVGAGQFVQPGPLTNNGWSTLRTPSGIAIDNLGEVVFLAESVVDTTQIVSRQGSLTFGFDFTITIPDNLPPGMYLPVFQGLSELNGERAPWEASGLFGTSRTVSAVTQTRLPIILNLGDTQPARLMLTLFAESPGEGARGLLADQDRRTVTLSNRTRFNSPTYILPPTQYANGQPISYPLEPYLLFQMPNSYATTAAPLVPFLLPGGRLNATVIRPDGSADNLGSTPLLQNQLSTAVVDERETYGEAVPLDIYRLTTLNPILTAYTFEQYGEHTIQLTGTLEDVWGNRYEGGGDYRVLIAEPLVISPGVLSGTAFEVGDAFTPSLRLLPGVPADVTVTVRVFPLDGGEPQTTLLEGRANRWGYFNPAGEPLRFTTPGEYTVDYEVRYTDSQARLWAGSLRSAGVIASPDTTLIAHGARGLSTVAADLRPAWYNATNYAAAIGATGTPSLFPNLPYHSGDIVWLVDGDRGGVQPVITVDDTSGVYARWLENQLPPEVLRERLVRAELPVTMLNAPSADYGPVLSPDALVNEGYSYFSAVRPGVTARQMVLGSESAALPSLVEPDDRYNRQTGAGLTGDRAGDFLFLFGGALLRNAEAQLAETAIYGALAVVVPENDPRGSRVYPPFGAATGGPNGGPLLTLDGRPINLFFVPTVTVPGQLLTVGDVLSVAGQVAPTLPSTVAVTVTSPSGAVRQFEAQANAVGYFYVPEQDIVTDEAGVWLVDVRVRHEGQTSAGWVEPPAPQGDILRGLSDRYVVYVVPEAAELLPLEWRETTIQPTQRANFGFTLPAGWTGVRVEYTLTMPGVLIDEGQLPVGSSTFSFPYAPGDISARFPNFEAEGRTTGAWVSDPLTLTIVLTGTDPGGQPGMLPLQIQFANDRLLSMAE